MDLPLPWMGQKSTKLIGLSRRARFRMDAHLSECLNWFETFEVVMKFKFYRPKITKNWRLKNRRPPCNWRPPVIEVIEGHPSEEVEKKKAMAFNYRFHGRSVNKSTVSSLVTLSLALALCVCVFLCKSVWLFQCCAEAVNLELSLYWFSFDFFPFDYI